MTTSTRLDLIFFFFRASSKRWQLGKFHCTLFHQKRSTVIFIGQVQALSRSQREKTFNICWLVSATTGAKTRSRMTTVIECFHMTSRRPYWYPKTMKRRPCWCPKPILWELNSFLMQTLSFVPTNLHRCWPREWKYSIAFSWQMTQVHSWARLSATHSRPCFRI